jgi:DNA-binding IclR family transcriptional regulator
VELKTVSKAFSLMELLANDGEFQLVELSRRLHMPKASTHRILVTLESLGYVQQDPRSLAYSASFKLFELGRNMIQNVEIVRLARPTLVELAAETGETVNLGVLDGVDIVCVDKVESKYHLRLDQPIGSRARAYQTAMGKAVLAWLPSEERARLLVGHRVVTSTPKSLGSVAAIEKALETVRRKGYATDNEEYMLGVRCVGAPIFDQTSSAIAGLSIAGPTVRMTQRLMRHFESLVVDRTTAISRQLGM